MAMNRTVLITGGTKRIGLAITQYLHKNGYNVIVTFNKSQTNAKKIFSDLNKKRENSCSIIQIQLSDTKSYKMLYKRSLNFFGRVDALVNNASQFYPTKINQIDEKKWGSIIDTNLKAPLFLSKIFYPELKKRKGQIINIIDIHVDPPLKSHIIYSISKSGLLTLTKSLAKELAPYVRVNGISPGAILWPTFEKSLKRKKDIISKIPLKRTGKPEDIAKAVKFLIEDGQYITGQNINIDGGRKLNM